MYFLMYHVIDVVNKMNIQNTSSKHRRLQARAYPGISKRVYSYHKDRMRRHTACPQTVLTHARTYV